MTESRDELIQIAGDLEQLTARAQEANVRETLDSLKRAAEQVGKAWSGSWLGYHANVYYRHFQPPPPGAHFNKAWGLKRPVAGLGSTGDWVEYSAEDVKATIYQWANCASLEHVHTFSDGANTEFRKQQRALLSIIEVEVGDSISPFLTDLKEKVGELKIFTENQFLQRLEPNYNFVLYDEVAGQQGIWDPPHLTVLSEVYAIQHTINIVESLADTTRQVESHVSRLQRRQQQEARVGNMIFIGHGHSPVWRELKIFLEDRLGLLVDEYNRVSNAGRTTPHRLSEMMDASKAAFLLMTGEDETPEGKFRARENVVHEVGLFQGRLGFERAIVLLEDGCEEFSNIIGLEQIRFDKGKIESAFEKIRMFLERENIISKS